MAFSFNTIPYTETFYLIYLHFIVFRKPDQISINKNKTMNSVALRLNVFSSLCILCSRFVLFMLSYYKSFRSHFRVVMSVTISAKKRCSVRLYLQLFVRGLMSYCVVCICEQWWPTLCHIVCLYVLSSVLYCLQQFRHKTITLAPLSPGCLQAGPCLICVL